MGEQSNGGNNPRNLTPTQELFAAIDEHDLLKFERAIRNGANINAFKDGYTPLMCIFSRWRENRHCHEMYKSMLDSLLRDPNIDVNIQSISQGHSALHLAIFLQNLDAVKLLLRHPGLDFSIKNRQILYHNYYSCTPLEYAKELGTPEIEREIENEIYKRSTLSNKVKFLLKGASPNIAKALIVTALGGILAASIVEYGALCIASILYATFAIGISIYLLNRFIYKSGVTSRYSDKRKEILFYGLVPLYCLCLATDMYFGKVNACQSSEIFVPALLSGMAVFMLGRMLACIMTDRRPEGSGRPAEAHYLPTNSLDNLELEVQPNIIST